MFEKIYIEISNVCNLKCKFCPEVIRENKLLSVEDFTRFAQEVKPLTKQVCLHLMGEPLAHPQFSEIMEICEKLNLRIFLTTNGTLIKKYSDQLLNWSALDQINFSVHSFFANNKQNNLEEYLNPILDFCDKSTKLNNSYYINLRLWNLKQSNNQLDQNSQVFHILNEHYKTHINENVDVKFNKSKKITNKLYVHFDTEFQWPSLEVPVRSAAGTCYGLRKQIAIHANGDLVPCCLDKESVIKLGNLNHDSILNILNSQRAKNIKHGFESNQLTEELCKRCQFADRFKGINAKENLI